MESSDQIIEVYSDFCRELDHSYSVWSMAQLPFQKDVLARCLREALTKTPPSNWHERLDLVRAYIRLARFIDPADAQLIHQAEKAVRRVGEKLSRGEKHSEEDHDLLSQYEETCERIHKRISQHERFLIAEIAALNAGYKIERTNDGYTISPVDTTPSGQRLLVRQRSRMTYDRLNSSQCAPKYPSPGEIPKSDKSS